jgi:hypothetical protein
MKTAGQEALSLKVKVMVKVKAEAKSETADPFCAGSAAPFHPPDHKPVRREVEPLVEFSQASLFIRTVVFACMGARWDLRLRP